METIEYLGWPNCIRLSNGQIELVATTAIGPRIIHCGFVGERNLFGVLEESKGVCGGDEWRLYGGHRLWHSPEAMPRSYSPDNSPVEALPTAGGVRLLQPVEADTGMQKEIEVSVAGDSNRVDVIHRITNRGAWAVELAPWALTVMAQGSEAIVPVPQGDRDSLLPNWRLTFWPYTNPADPRLRWGEKYIRMRQDPATARKCKLGLSAADGWVGCLLEGFVFLKRFDYEPEAEYPDWGAAVELFTNDAILEVETLGPLCLLEPGETVEHCERWYLLRDVHVDGTEESVDRALMPLVWGSP